MEPIEGAEGDTFTTGELNEDTIYCCQIADKYGDHIEVNFSIRVIEPAPILVGENELYAYVTGTEYLDETFCYLEPNEEVNMSVTAGAIDTEGMTIQWGRRPISLHNGVFAFSYNPNPFEPLEGVTTNEYSVIPDSSYTYQCAVSDAYGNTKCVYFYVIVQNQLHLEGVDADNQTLVTYDYSVAPGTSRELKVSTTALDPEGIVYQWYKLSLVTDEFTYYERLPIEGATSDTYTTEALYEYVEYYCEAIDKYGDHYGIQLNVSVNNALQAYVTGTDHLKTVNVYVQAREEVELSVTAEANDLVGITYQWSKRDFFLRAGHDMGVASSDPFTEITGATGSVFTGVPEHTALYECYVTDAYGNTAMVLFRVMIQNIQSIQVIGADYSVGNQNYYSIEPGTSAELQVSVNALDMEGITYQWYEGLGNGETPIEGATTDSYTTGVLNEEKTYFCVVSDDKTGDRNYWVTFHLEIHADNQLYAYVTGTDRQKTVDLYVQPNEEVTLSVTAEAVDESSITYKLSKTNFNLMFGNNPGANSFETFSSIAGATESVVTVVPNHTASYRCWVDDGCGNVSIVVFRVMVRNIQSVQAVGADSSEEYTYYYSVAPDTSAELQVSVDASDMQGITYQWYKGSAQIRGANTDSYTTDALNEDAVYRCLVSDQKYGDAYWVVCDVQVQEDNELFAYITGTEHKKTINVYIQPGEEVELSVTVEANDLEGITYQWCKRNFFLYAGRDFEVGSSDPFTDITGATDSVFTGVPDHTALYMCVVYDAYDNTSIVVFRVIVQNIQSIQAVGADSSEGNQNYYSIEPNTAAELQVSVNALDPEGITYQWYEGPGNDPTPIEGATTDSYITDALNEEKMYICEVSDDKYGDLDYWVVFHIEINEAPHEHTYISEVTQPATCTDPGVRTYTCTGCEDSYTEVIPALGHDLQFVAEVAPTVQASGCKAHYKCSRCDKLFLDAEGKTETTADILKTPQLKTGWQKVDGQWYYYDAAGEVCTGWTKVGKSWYYLGTDGAMTTGWQKVGKSWYYMNSSGVMQTDWQKIGGKWYYLGTNGVMRTKWQQIDEKWYYFGTDGKMVTGWKQISEKWYYFNSSGVMQTKWQQISGKWYYLGTDGVMCTGWQKISKKWYYLGTDGVMCTGWQKISKKWYYFNSSGVMMTGTQTIDGKNYTFDSSGVWTGK